MIQRDKIAHMASYFGAGVFVGWFLPIWASMLIFLLPPIIWEYTWKYYCDGVVDFNDIIFSWFGAIIGIVFIKLI